MLSYKGIFVAVLLTSIFSSNMVFANDDVTQGTGNELRNTCNHKNYENKDPVWFLCIEDVYGLAQGYSAGVVFGLVFGSGHKASDADIKKWQYWCMPQAVTREQAALVVSKFLDDHPERLNESDVILVTDAFHVTWPCPKK